MLVSLTTYVDLAVASSIDQNGWFGRVALHKREVLAVPGQVIQTVLYCMPGGLKVARSILDNVVCYGVVGLLTATLQVSLLNLSVLMCILMA